VIDQPTSVYRYYDARAVLLYVGITHRGMTRQVEHNLSKDWWGFVAHQTVEHFPTRAAAEYQEQYLIGRYRPPFNTVHNPTWRTSRAGYLAVHHLQVKQQANTQSVRAVLGSLARITSLDQIDVERLTRGSVALRILVTEAMESANDVPDLRHRLKSAVVVAT
jgi:hypothetical protein